MSYAVNVGSELDAETMTDQDFEVNRRYLRLVI
jgi:hypothetical protein